MFKKKLLVGALASIGLMVSNAAVAGPMVDLDFTGPTYGSFESGTANGSGNLAGQFNFNVQNGESNPYIDWPSGGPLEAFCIDLDTTLIQSLTGYELKTASQYFSANLEIVTNLDRLYSTHFDKVEDSTTSAAFQLGIWEILADTTGAPDQYDLSDGSFQASGYANGADGTASTWLSNLGTATGYQFLVLDSTVTPNGSQDLLIVNPPPKVPEPGTLALLGLGLAGLALRKRKA